MPEKVNRSSLSVNTIIGPNTEVTGDLFTGGFTRVDGNVHGDMDAKGRVVVGERARMKSNIVGTAITIGGIVQGNILASERLVVLSTGFVIGDVITRRIQADEGCVIHGKVTVCTDEAGWQRALAEYKDSISVRHALSSGEVAGVRA
ncbi:MAG: polymer-forming cytoskeletal protein [Spirochaetaceae bacterium]|jgi:cytoskeletal protein CcmA (bactofilin family)|nr:polymer-forming cytoskeletal protein [Spirochaetaceae bacterium]